MTTLLTEGKLKTHPFVAGCSSEFLNCLDEHSTEVAFDAGQILLREGDIADRFYLLLSGKVAITLATEGATATVIDTLGAGELLGWSWLLPPYKLHFGATALEPGTAILLNGASLMIQAEQNPRFGYELLKRVSKQVVRRLQSTCGKLATERLLKEGAD